MSNITDVLVASDEGSKTGGGASTKFYARAYIYATEETSTKVRLTAKSSVYLNGSGLSGTTITYSGTCGSGTKTFSSAGTYASGSKDLGWYNRGSKATATMTAYYTGGSGTTYRSEASASYTVPSTPQWLTKYTVSYSANGGSVAPSSQTKWKDEGITLSSTKPTRSGYNFKGWATSSAGSVAYASGASYTANASVTLYAVWETAYIAPTVSIASAVRCDSNGTANADGTYAKVTASYAVDTMINASNVATKAVVEYRLPSSTSWSSMEENLSAASGTVSMIVGGGNLATGNAYIVRVTVYDSGGSKSGQVTLAATFRPLDIGNSGKTIAIGKTASDTDGFEIATPTRLENDVQVFFKNASGEARSMLRLNGSNNFHIGAGGYDSNDCHTYLSGKRVYIRSNEYISITSPTAGLTDRQYGVNKVLWSGAAYMYASQTATLSEAISAQPHGIVLIFSSYDVSTSSSQDYSFHSFFVPKAFVNKHSGCGMYFIMTRGIAPYHKYIYIHDTKLTGYKDNNDSSIDIFGHTGVDNRNMVLRYVIGV